MPTPSQNRAHIKYRAKAYDQVVVMIPKGDREIWKAKAEAKGLSLNAYIKQLVENDT